MVTGVNVDYDDYFEQCLGCGTGGDEIYTGR
jgi:hypothetical protein